MAARGEPPLSDTELRNELKRLGFAPGPITATTRSLLFKKLEKLKDQEKKQPRKAPANKISSRNVFGLSSDESEGESAGNSRGTAPVSTARRRSGARTLRTAPQRTTKRLSTGTKTSQITRKIGSRRSAAVEANDSENEEGDNDYGNDAENAGGHGSNNRLDLDRHGNEGSIATNVRTVKSGTGRRSIRPDRGAGDQSNNSARSRSTDTLHNRRGEFSDSEGEMLSKRSVRNRVKRGPTNSRTSGAIGIVRNTSDIRSTANDDDKEGDEDDDDDSASDNSGKRNTDSSKDRSRDDSGRGRWSFFTRRTPPRSEPLAPVSKDDGNDENSSANWTFITSRFNSSRTSTPRKSVADDTAYYTTIAGNSMRKDVPPNSVATPISGRPTLRGSTVHTPSSNHTFLGQTPPTVSSSNSPRYESTSVGNQSFPMNNAQTPTEELSFDEAQVFATEENLGSSWKTKYSHCVSKVLLVSVCMFFILLGLMYLSVNSTGKLGHLQIADLTGGDDVDFSGDELPLLMIQALHNKLSKISGDFVCGKSSVRNMSMEEVTIFWEENVSLGQRQNKKPFWVAENMPRILKLITTNPQWELRLFDKTGDPITEYNYENKVAWLDSSYVSMTLFCQVKTTALRLLFYASVIIISLLFLWPGFYLFQYQMLRKEQERQEVTQLVDKIIEVLANHQQACYQDKSLTPYLAIPHVRDTLISPAERQKKQHLWLKAVQFLNVNESRVRVETQQVAGEEFAVWRWVQPSPAVAVTSFSPITERDMNPKRTKVWQGTAFANLDAAVKASPYSYTPCLKIRNMFDPTLESGSNWHVAIQDAILERCGEDNGIVHIAVDKNSREGCVYVKCVSSEKAGMAFRCLQGSWFDGKLVTVKYIKLDRYHQRFPSAVDIITPIQPSNNLRMSLQPLPGSAS